MVPENLIKQVVETFYARIRKHPDLGPVFQSQVEDWSAHLPRMIDFWHSVLNTSGRYKGRPVPAHRRLPNLSAELFAEWLTLWRATTREIADPETADLMIEKAERVAQSLAAACLEETASSKESGGRPPVFARVA